MIGKGAPGLRAAKIRRAPARGGMRWLIGGRSFGAILASGPDRESIRGREPRKDFARPVRELATTTASLMLLLLSYSLGGREQRVQTRQRLRHFQLYPMIRDVRPLKLFVCPNRRTSFPPQPIALAVEQAPKVRRARDETH